MDVGGHLRGLFRFAGRERRTTFWLWVLISYIAYMAVGMIGMVPVMAGMFSSFARLAAEHPDFGQPGTAPLPPAAMFDLMPIRSFMAVSAASFAFAVLMLAAALTRRLHDAGRSGWWGVLPLPFVIGFLALFVPMFSSVATMRPGTPAPVEFRSFAGLMFCDLAYLASIVTLIVFCCLPTLEHPNRYGPPPGPRVG